jgi:solute carrier family 25 protein 38
MRSIYRISLAYLFPPKSNGEATVIHGLSAASAGAIATLATHPFDVIKVGCF